MISRITGVPEGEPGAGPQKVGVAVADLPKIDAVLVSTCTGYLCPGLTSYIGERLGLRPEVLTLDLVGQIAVILAGVFAVLALFRKKDSHD